MPRYRVTVSIEATALADVTVEVEAPNRRRAVEAAIDQARRKVDDRDFTIVDKNGEEVTDVTELDEED